ncbi:unnamed protein product [Gongylonema pulchrum]|uniref:SRCR domain-containing protein n=1 Tax=Gongylonema pulchrum TaxID=637853 RepID=A0A183CXC9_9BILA|nr:unnamed protein product [Gongylonema pulchrum]
MLLLLAVAVGGAGADAGAAAGEKKTNQILRAFLFLYWTALVMRARMYVCLVECSIYDNHDGGEWWKQWACEWPADELYDEEEDCIWLGAANKTTTELDCVWAPAIEKHFIL